MVLGVFLFLFFFFFALQTMNDWYCSFVRLHVEVVHSIMHNVGLCMIQVFHLRTVILQFKIVFYLFVYFFSFALFKKNMKKKFVGSLGKTG